MKTKIFFTFVISLLLIITACSDSKSTEPELKHANVVISLNAPNEESVVGSVVTLTNNGGNHTIVYEQVASSNSVVITDVVFGSYTLTVYLVGYSTYSNSNFSVQTATVNHSVTLRYYSIGDTGPGGGIIFYDKGDDQYGWRYLEAAPLSSEFIADWGAWTGNHEHMEWHDVPGTFTSIGTGKRNTVIIIDRLKELGQTHRAAQLCNELNINVCSDWFLPSKDELNKMYEQKSIIGGFTNDFYWSSSQSTILYTWIQDFTNGYQDTYDKSGRYRVRAVRAF